MEDIYKRLQDSVYGQESSHGKADTSKANYAGAIGPMQIIGPTFEGMKKNGQIPLDWDINNPEHSKAAGEIHLRYLFDKYKDPGKAAAAYYSGEKAVKADGTIANFSDPKNPKAPTTHQYVAEVLGRMNLSVGDESGETFSVPDRKPVASMAGLEPYQLAEGGSWNTRAEQSMAETREVIEEQSAVSFRDQIGVASLWQTIPGSVFRAMVRPEFETVPGYNAVRDSPELFNNRGEDDWWDLAEAVSPEHAQRIAWEIGERENAMKMLGAKGTPVALAASFMAGAPEGLLLGLGAAKGLQLARLGSMELAAQGRTAGTVVSSIGEQVGVNVGATATLDMMGDHQTAADYAMAAGFGLLGTTLQMRSLLSASEFAALRQSAERTMEVSARETKANFDEAIRRAGPDATPEQIRAEVAKIEGEKVKAVVEEAQTELPDNRKLLPYDPNENPPTSTAMDMGTQAPIRRASDAFDRIAGVDREVLRASPNKVTISDDAKAAPNLALASQALEKLARFLPDDHRLILTTKVGQTPEGRSPQGVISTSGNLHAIALRPDLNASQALRSLVHEVGHALEATYLPNVSKELWARIDASWSKTLDGLLDRTEAAMGDRYSVSARSPDMDKVPVNDYLLNKREWMAEQFVKYVEDDALKNGDKLGLGKGLMWRLKQYALAAIDLFLGAKKEAYLGVNPDVKEFFDGIAASRGTPVLDTNTTATAYSLETDIGAHLMPADTAAQQSEKKMILHLHEFAKQWHKDNPIDAGRLKSIADNQVFNVASTSLIMLKSNNPVVRMVAGELLENPSGGAGRRSTAALGKFLEERKYMGNAINEVQLAYKVWRNSKGGNVIGDFFGGENWKQFNREVAQEIERRGGAAGTKSASQEVNQAADVLQAAYERMRVAQVGNKTPGWASLPETSVGYMPHRMSAEKILNLTNAQRGALHSALTDQFVKIEGWDMSFADKLASKYIDRVQERARGSYESGMGVHQVGAPEIIEDALRAMGMSQPEIKSMMDRFMRGAPGHTKRRIRLDLNQAYTDDAGNSFRLLDLFETDQFELLRQQARRVSGEVALWRHGVAGKSGLKVLRRAMEFGTDAEKATGKELEAFDQVAAEFLGEPFGTQGGKWLDRAITANSLARLGGMGFTQMSEYINGIAHVGAARTMAAVAGLPRLRSEIMKLAKGEKVDNPVLSSIEQVSGAEFGTDAYKMVFPFDQENAAYQTYGRDTITNADRLLRGATHAQGKLSFWRAIHSAQQRGFAEQIVRKAMRYINEGKEDMALRDMGFTPELVAKIKADMPNTSKFNGGDLTEFDLTKSKMEPADVQALVQNVHRGVNQIIQGTFIGETGKWAHDGLLRLATQFRTFSITSMEKQWTRQVGNNGGGTLGTAKAMGILLGSMSVAAPIYMARVLVNSMGREDQDEYLEKQLAPAQIARATMNYVAMSGLSGDFLDAFTSVTGIGEVTGGRSAAGSQFVGNVIAPAAGYADDLWRSVQNTKDGTDPTEFFKAMPFSKLPYMVPLVNALGEELSTD